MPTYDPETTTSAVFSGPGVLEFPFKREGDTTTKLVSQTFFQQAKNYTPLALNTAYSASANFGASPPTIGSAYCVGDTDVSQVDAGGIEFRREWANIPATRSVPMGSYSFNAPGVPAVVVGTPKTVTASTGTSHTATGHGYSVSDVVFLFFILTNGLGDFFYANVQRTVLTVPDANTFTTDTVFSTLTLSNGVAYQTTPGLTAGNRVTSCTYQYDYALPGVTAGVTTAADFDALPVFRAFNPTTGEPATELDANTSPTATQYNSMISAGTPLVAESSVKVWKGNILERVTIYVRAV